IRRVGETMDRDVKSGDVRSRQQLRQLVQEVSFPAADIENARSRAEVVMIDQRPSDSFPASIVPVPAVPISPVAIPVVALVFFCFPHAVDLVVHHARQIIALGPLVKRCHHFKQLSHYLLPVPPDRWQLITFVGCGTNTTSKSDQLPPAARESRIPSPNPAN